MYQASKWQEGTGDQYNSIQFNPIYYSHHVINMYIASKGASIKIAVLNKYKYKLQVKKK